MIVASRGRQRLDAILLTMGGKGREFRSVSVAAARTWLLPGHKVDHIRRKESSRLNGCFGGFKNCIRAGRTFRQEPTTGNRPPWSPIHKEKTILPLTHHRDMLRYGRSCGRHPCCCGRRRCGSSAWHLHHIEVTSLLGRTGVATPGRISSPSGGST